MNKQIALILSGSCTPACDLLAGIAQGLFTLPEATSAYNARLPKRERLSLDDAARMERTFMRKFDI